MRLRRASDRTHCLWSCADKDGMEVSCWLPQEPDPYVNDIGRAPHPGPCLCDCHGDETYMKSLEARGLHVHSWKVKVFDLSGSGRKVSIKCQLCKMTPPPWSKPHIIKD